MKAEDKDKEKVKKLANKLVGYMIAEINYDCKQGNIVNDTQLTERFRDNYKTWKQLMMNPDEFIALFAVEVEKLVPKMRNNWR